MELMRQFGKRPARPQITGCEKFFWHRLSSFWGYAYEPFSLKGLTEKLLSDSGNYCLSQKNFSHPARRREGYFVFYLTCGGRHVRISDGISMDRLLAETDWEMLAQRYAASVDGSVCVGWRKFTVPQLR